jgi:very-short-patch-repair endonuclease
LREDWRALGAEVDAIAALAQAFATIDRVSAAVEESGAPLWAERLRDDPVLGVEDPWTPADWQQRWRSRRLAGWLIRIDRHDALRDLHQRRTGLEHQLRRAYEEAIELRTWCRLAEKASDQVRAALASYAQAMRRLGRGTGIRAGRYRQDARLAADRAKNALPCWIMPTIACPNRCLPNSACSISSSWTRLAVDHLRLPALLRAQQLLIVGDDRQVSPDAGLPRGGADERARRPLSGRPGRRLSRRDARGDVALRPWQRRVLRRADHAQGAFPLRRPDHRIFKGAILRAPAGAAAPPLSSERLDPPLVDILVEDGARRGKVNPAEVDCIVDEIGRIAADPALASRSIGVTTLLGHEQAKLAFDRIEQVHGPEIMLRHDIRVGEPGAFQGDERDIMFVSMVATTGSSPLTGRAYDQRFNVAASRARDRMILVRSVEPADLSPSDQLRRSLIDHFAAPFAMDAAVATERRARCESGFETELFDLLVAHGYHVDTQVRVGTKRIDLVVEGEQDRRLAIECDGDAFHGADRWPEDMARQRMLERAGWTVWRCFASRFVRERDAVMAELIATLAAHDIHPWPSGDRPQSRHSEHRRWRTPGAEEAEPVPYAWLVPADPF